MQIKANLTANQSFTRRYGVRAVTALGFALVIGILLISIVGSYHTTTQHNVELSRLVRDAGMKTVFAYTMREVIRERINILYDMAAHTDPFARDEDKMRFFAYAGKYVQARESLTAKLTNDRERRMLEQLDASARLVMAPNEEALAALFDQTASANAIRSAVQAAVDSHLALLGTLDELVRTIHQTTQQQIRNSGDEYHEKVLTTALAGMAAFAVAVGIAAFVVFNTGQRNRPLPHHATYDLLTGLLNRQAFEASLGLTLELEDALNGRHDNRYDDESRSDGPGDLQPHVAVDLLGPLLSGPLPEPDQYVGKQGPDHDQDDHGPPEDRDVELVAYLSVIRHRVDRGLEVFLPTGRTEGCEEEDSQSSSPTA